MTSVASATVCPMRVASRLPATLLLLLAASCGGGDPVGAASAGSNVAASATISSSANAKPASSWGPFPTAARRDSAPPGIQTQAAAEGAKAPLFALPAIQGEWSLEEGLSKTKYVVLVFYRGAW